MAITLPKRIGNWIHGEERFCENGEGFDKLAPTTGALLLQAARSGAAEVDLAVTHAQASQRAWAALPGVRRGEILWDICAKFKCERETIASVAAQETGKSMSAALGETNAAISLGCFFAGEGQRLFGRTMPSALPHRHNLTLRQPIGVAGLIVAANTPIANVAWKMFPALICGNSAVMKSAEDAPATAWLMGRLATEAGLPHGVFNVVHGLGHEAGAALAAHPSVGVVSFTGSTAVGRHIAQACNERLARVSLELGGKNPFVVCEDADLPNAIKWALLSAFSNAGQRCAAGSRIIVAEAIYDSFRGRFVEATRTLKLGTGDQDDLGPVVNLRQLTQMLTQVEQAVGRGARLLTGGRRSPAPGLASGYYMEPTLLEGVAADDPISSTELFGPIACLYRVRDFGEAIALANQSPYGLTASIHTKNYHRAMEFIRAMHSGVVSVNGGTHGSEPHMPFGGTGASGNGTREPGTEALDVYSELRNVYLNFDPEFAR